MSIKVGTTDISAVGKIKLGTSNITKVYQGTNQILPSVSVFSYTFGAGWGLEIEACNLTESYPNTLYTDQHNDFWALGTRFYTNSSLTVPFNGSGLYYVAQLLIGAAFAIDEDGYIIIIYNCGF